MALAEDIRALRDRVLTDLTATHDYYTDTKYAWRIVHQVAKAGQPIVVRNRTTGTVTTGKELVAKARGYVASQLTEATFQQFLAVFETFFLDLLRLWLLAYPRSLGSKQVDFETVLAAPDKDAIALIVVNRELHELMHKGPADWFAYLERRVKLGRPTEPEIERFAEAKASRDVLVHNRGIANKTYLQKAGRLARYQDGESIDIPNQYHREVWELIRKLVADISDAAAAAAPPT